MRAPGRTPSALRLRLTDGPLPEQLAGARRAVERWAQGLGVGEEFVEDVVLAAHEALANAADHAYPDGAGEAALDGECADGVLLITIRDHGTWRVPAADPGWRGRGLVIIRGLADEVDLQHDASGTVVRMRWKLS
jgi:serine/threonine-protein kinase RsbW